MTTRFTTTEVAQIDVQRVRRGGLSRSAYIRWLIQHDAVRLEREDEARG